MARRRRQRKIDRTPVEGVIESVTHEGKGVTRNADGKTVFVDGALAGERVIYKPMKAEKNYDLAMVEEVLEASPDRIEPRCPSFGVCGGCAMQHLEPKKQIETKQQVLLDNLQRLGGVEPEMVLEPLTGPLWGYRYKARLAVKSVYGKGRVLVGFREKFAPYVVDMTSCDVLHPAISELLPTLSEVIGSLSIHDKVPQIEVAVGEEDAEDSSKVTIALVFRNLEEPTTADIEALQAFAKAYEINTFLQPKGLGSTYAIYEVAGASTLKYLLPEYDVAVSFEPHDFTQVNPALNRKMVPHALRLLEPSADDNILELFAGLGNFTLPIARSAKKITIVEGDAALIKRAEQNAREHGVTNINAHVADLYEANDEATWANKPYDKVLLDPPRSGAKDQVLEAIAKTGAKRIVYVSCHPGTLARDAGELVNKFGYRLVAAGVMDMFPHTAHVESIACFVKD